MPTSSSKSRQDSNARHQYDCQRHQSHFERNSPAGLWRFLLALQQQHGLLARQQLACATQQGTLSPAESNGSGMKWFPIGRTSVRLRKRESDLQPDLATGPRVPILRGSSPTLCGGTARRLQEAEVSETMCWSCVERSLPANVGVKKCKMSAPSAAEPPARTRHQQ
jgi:hypothetical protein